MPIYKCYITPHWAEAGEAHIIVARKNQRGDLVVGSYLVDTFCLGLKDTYWNIIGEADLKSHVEDSDMFEETTYPVVHNLILGAIEFAEEAGIEPAPGFELTQYILAEDTDDIELIEYEYGYKGKHHLVIGDDGAERKYAMLLTAKLGDKFTFEDPYTGVNTSVPQENDDYEYEGYPHLEHQYDYPEYPAAPVLKHPWLLDILYDPDAWVLATDDLDRIMALPYDELGADIDTIVRYEIGRTYKAIEEGQDDDIELYSVLEHCLAIINAIAQPENFATVVELLHQTDEFIDQQLGYEAENLLPGALCRTTGNDVSRLEGILNEKGYTACALDYVLLALCMIAYTNPDMRFEVQEAFRRLLVNMVERLPETDRCDPDFAGFVLEYVSCLDMRELLDEVKSVLATGYVDAELTGGTEEYLSQFGEEKLDSVYVMPSIYDFYAERRRARDKYNMS